MHFTCRDRTPAARFIRISHQPPVFTKNHTKQQHNQITQQIKIKSKSILLYMGIYFRHSYLHAKRFLVIELKQLINVFVLNIIFVTNNNLFS